MAINSLSYSSNGYAGLVSGIDTESVVKEMLSGTQAKIDSAEQSKQTLLYKQTMYRDVATQLKTLQTSYMSFSSSTNLLSSSFFNQMSTTLRTPIAGQNPAFSVSATSSSSPGTYKLTSISQLATAYSIKTKGVTSGAVSGAFNAEVANNLLYESKGGDVPRDASLVIQVGDQSVTLENAPQLLGGKSSEEIVDIINAEFEAAGVAGEAAFVNNKLTIYADDPDAFIRVHGNLNADAQDADLSMQMFGDGLLDLSGQGTFSASIDSDLYLPSFTVELDGREQEIYLSYESLEALATVDAEGNAKVSDGGTALLADLTTSLSRAFGTGVEVSASGGVITFDTGSSSSTLVLTGSNTSMELFGLTSGISNKLNASLALDDLNFATSLQGSRHSFSINGVDFAYDSTTSLSTIINDINNSKAGVKVIYQEAEDKFIIQRAETGHTDDSFNPIEMSQSEGNLLSALFGVEGGSDYSSHGIGKVMTSASAVAASEYQYGGTYKFNVNGSDYTFTVPQKSGIDERYTAEEFTELLNESFRSSFGTMADGKQSIEFAYDGDQFTITANKDSLVVKMPTGTQDSNVKTLGFASDASTQITDGATTLSDAGIQFGTGGSITVQHGDGTSPIVLTADELNGLTLDQVAEKLQTAIRTADPSSTATVEFDKNTAGFRILGIDIPMDILIDGGAGGENTENLFGSNEVKLHQAANADATEITHGTNAEVWIDGVMLERSSNTFEYNNMTFTVNSLYNAGEGAAGAATEVVVERDTEVIAETLQEFLTVYNETITMLNEMYTADATYKDYPPLTTDQKAGMSDTEIENWEEKSKEGLLRMDDNLFSILESMRSSMYTRPLGSSIAIYDLGIDTSFYSEDGHFNLSSESDLIAALEQDPEAVMNLFAGPGGIMEQLNTSINEAVGSTGYLTREAGVNSLDVNSNIYKQIEDIDEQLLTLEDRYWSEYDRYWTQFNSMELYIQEMNEQMSWLQNSLSGSTTS